ncbi:MAG TPA: hypothetical protein VMU72_06390 [Gaiellaceae bacterium]|nr:hypothetical protein [Gaiellaceae bacterium]
MWDWAVWGALAVAICSGIAGVVLVFARVREALRRIKSLRSGAVACLGTLTRKAEVAAAKAESAGDTRELQESVARLRRSIAQLAILRAAIAEVEERLGWVRVIL